MKIFKREYFLKSTLTRQFFLPLILLITLASFLSLGTFKLSLPVEAEGEIEIYSIEDLYSINDNLTASYVLMNDLDFDDPASWEDYSNADTIYTSIGTDRGAWAESIEYSRYDYVSYIGKFWYATRDHTSTSSNKPSTWSSYWAETTNSPGYNLGWESIGEYITYEDYNCFNGIFDGQGFEIKNLYIDNQTYQQALFACNSGLIKNVGVTDVDINSANYIGALVGINGPSLAIEEKGVIENSYSTGSISADSYIGGLVGVNKGFSIIDYCHSTVDVTQENYNVGGLVGDNSGTIKDSYFQGNVTSGYGGDIGGLVGHNYEGKIVNSYYNIDYVTIDGSNILTTGGLYNSEFTEWLANGRYLNPDNYLTNLNGYYQINTLGDFKALLAFGQVPNLKFELNTNLDLTTEPNFYIPYLAGEFEGNGYEISNLSYLSTGDKICQIGLFGIVDETGVVKNIGSINVNIEAGYNLGGLVGENRGVIDSTYSTGSVSINSWGEQTGGLVGDNYGIIRKSYSTADVSGNIFTGGLVGRNINLIENSYATGSVAGYYFAAGLVGSNSENILNSYATGSVTDLAGYDYGIKGLVGYLSGETLTENSFWDTENSGISTSASGTGKTTLELKSISTFNDPTGTDGLDSPWSIETKDLFDPSQGLPWYIDDGNDYPKLAMQFLGPEVETELATNITKTSATISGELTTLASEPTVDVYFRYRVDGSGWTTTTALTKTSTEEFSANLTGLTPGTTYEYSTVVTWRDVGTDYGETMYFTTIPDLILPTGSIKINDDKIHTVSKDVTLSLSATDDLTGVSQMMVCNNSSFTGCTWESYSSSKSWTLTSEEGTKSVYVKFKDGAGNISSVYSDSIILHTPSVRITDIGQITNVLDKSSLKYYFTSTKPVIKGLTQANSTVTFEYNDEINSTQADGDGNFNITLEVSSGSNEIEYYSTDTSGNVSATRELKLIVGTENFPEWLLEKLGLIMNKEPDNEVTEEENEVEDETKEDESEDQEDTYTPPVTYTKKIKFTDKRGKPLAQATVEIEGNTYITNDNGEIEIENLENRTYTAKIKTKDGKEYSMDILGVGDESESMVVEVTEENERGIDWVMIFIYTSVGLVAIVLFGMLINSKKN